MNKTKNFLSSFITAEVAAHTAYRKPNIEHFNLKLEELYEFATYPLEVGLGSYLKSPLSSSFYEEVDFMNPISERYIFKISRYKSEVYTNLYACYLSRANHDDYKAYRHCFFIGEVEVELKIVAQHSFDLSKSRWFFTGGDRTLKFANIGKPIEIEKLVEPTHKASFDDYIKNK